MPDYVTKDSGVRQDYASGMRRDTQEGKAHVTLLIPLGVPYNEQFLIRCAMLMSRGMEKYGWRNWELADSDVELERFKGAALRHLMQWITGETDEDHAAAVVFNLLAAETTKYRIQEAACHTSSSVRGPRSRVYSAIWSSLRKLTARTRRSASSS